MTRIRTMGAINTISIKQMCQTLLADLASQTFNGQITLAEVRLNLAQTVDRVAERIMLPLSQLLSLEDLIDLIVERDQIPLDVIMSHLDPSMHQLHQQAELRRDHLIDTLVSGFQHYLWPYLSQAKLISLQPRLHPYLNPASWFLNQYHHAYPLFRLGACLGMHQEIYALTQSWPDSGCGGMGFYGSQYCLEIIFGLGSAELVEAETRRLKPHFNHPTYIRAWLAHTEYSALDVICDDILELSNKAVVEDLLKTFALVRAPEAAPYMLTLLLSSKAPQVARQWFDENSEHATTGLIPIAAGRGKLAEAALNFLLRLRRKGYTTLIESCLAQAPAEMARRVRAAVLESEVFALIPFDPETTPTWLSEALSGLKWKRPAKRPGWVDPVILPPIQIGRYRLNDSQVGVLLQLLQKSKPDQPPPALISALKAHVDLVSLESFAWALFELWLQDGAPNQDKWALGAVGWLGGDAVALKLAQLIRLWPGEGQHQRAVLGLECLRMIGTDTALLQMNAIAQKIKFKALKAAAGKAVEAIAQARNLSREQLEDRIVPDCGLDETGSRSFNFGSRRFRLALGLEMKPMVRNEHGKILPNLPKPNLKDDPNLAVQAIADWKLLKKQVQAVAKVQAFRLEQAMITGRRWSAAEFEPLLVKHPLMINLVRLLLWGGYDDAGQLICPFRVTEDVSYADVQDEVVNLASFALIGLVHSLLLSEKEKAAWGEVWSDYELISPFAQLDREIYRLEPQEQTATELTRFANINIPAASLVGTLEKSNWTRGLVGENGNFFEHSKSFSGANLTAVVEYEQGVPAGYIVDRGDQHISRCFFVAGSYRPTLYTAQTQRLPLGQVPPIIISEVLRDLTLITLKGR